MSALTPHIRMMRAQAAALERVAEIELNETGRAVLLALVKAKRAAADILEEEERALAESVKPKTGDVKYNPKGKP